MGNEAERTQEPEITCPYCGYIFDDSFECGEDNEKEECPECEKIFSWSKVVDVSYTSRGNCSYNGEEHDFEWVDTTRNKDDPKGAFFCQECPQVKLSDNDINKIRNEAK